MGAEFNQMIVNSTKTSEIRTAFENAKDQDLHENGHSYSGGWGMCPDLSVKSNSFESANAASDWLADNCQKWESALAVEFKSKDGTIKTMIGAWCSS
jgi:hypothetical protein